MKKFTFEVNRISDALLRFTETDIPKMSRFHTDLVYRTSRAEFSTLLQGESFDDILAHEFALLTLKEKGSAPDGYTSISKDTPHRVGMYVGAILDRKYLIISDFEQNGMLGRPARLSFNDLIGYERLKRLKE